MSERRILITAIEVLLLGGAAIGAAATVAQNQQISFSEEAVILIPPPQPDGAEATRVFARWGIELSSEGGAPPIIGTRTVLPFEGLPTDSPVILNGVSAADAGALVISFSAPARRIAVELGAEAATEATVRYFDADGLQLGEEILSLLDGYTWLGGNEFEDAGGREISQIEIEYQNQEEPEALFLLRVDFVSPPSFRTCIAQVAHGAIPTTDHALQTQLSVTSSAFPTTYAGRTPDAQIQLELLDSSGEPSNMLLDGQPSNPFEFEIKGVRSRILRTATSGPDLARGYVCVTSKYPVELAAVYRILTSDGHPVSEAGIQGSSSGYRFFGVFQKEVLEKTDTAIAIANVSEELATVLIRFHFPLGVSRLDEVTWFLEPGEQRAWFLQEFVPDLADEDAQGTIEIVSHQAIIATSLRTIGGVVSASLPLGKSFTADNE